MNLFKSAIIIVVALTVINIQAISQSTSVNQSSEITKTIDVKVKGITCSKDLVTIAQNVEKLEGVASCKAAKKGATTTFEVIMNPALVSDEKVHAAIENTGGCKNPNDRPYKVKQ
jgi:copper chaperone CopZ